MRKKSLLLALAMLAMASVANGQLRGRPTGNVIEVELTGLNAAINGTYDVYEYDMGRWGGKQWTGETNFGHITITDGAFARGIGVQLHFNRKVVATREVRQVDPIYGNVHVHYHRIEIPSRISYGTGNSTDARNITTSQLTTLVMPFGETNDPALAGGRVGTCRITKR